MAKTNMVGIAMNDDLFNKFRDYWIDRENITQGRIPAAEVARELIEYALDSMNGKKDITQDESMTWETRPAKDDKPDKVPDAKEDAEHNMFKDIIV